MIGMAHVDPGELKYNVQILIPTRKMDANNHYIKGPDKVINTRAAVRAAKSRDEITDGAERMIETLQLILRWRTDVNSAAAVVFRGRRYEIEFVDPTPWAGCYMRIRAVSYDAGVGE